MRPTRTTTAPRRGQGRTSMAPRRPLGARRTSTHVVRHCPTAGTTTACRSCRRRIPAPPSSPDVDPVVGGPNPAQGALDLPLYIVTIAGAVGRAVPLLRHGARAELRRRPRRRRPGGPRGIPTFPSGSGREGRRGREALVRGARSPPESPEAGATRAFRGCVLYEHMLSNRIDQNLQH
jgi:hypothetical protein